MGSWGAVDRGACAATVVAASERGDYSAAPPSVAPCGASESQRSAERPGGELPGGAAGALHFLSGTEAVMSAIRVARACTARDLIGVKFAGCYHGHADHLLVAAGSALATFGFACASRPACRRPPPPARGCCHFG